MNETPPTEFKAMPTTPSPAAPTSPLADPDSTKLINSGDLFEGAREIRLEHHGSVYRLRITKSGKLILNK